jgi:hypothetical protein
MGAGAMLLVKEGSRESFCRIALVTKRRGLPIALVATEPRNRALNSCSPDRANAGRARLIS